MMYLITEIWMRNAPWVLETHMYIIVPCIVSNRTFLGPSRIVLIVIVIVVIRGDTFYFFEGLNDTVTKTLAPFLDL